MVRKSADGDSELLFVFAGVWAAWSGVWKVKEGSVDVELFGFLTTQSNALARPIHEKAMPGNLEEPGPNRHVALSAD